MGERQQTRGEVTRRTFLRLAGAAGAIGQQRILSASALAAQVEGDTPEERAINGAKALKKNLDLNILIWGQYYAGRMRELATEFKQKTGIGIGAVQDIATPTIPGRVMAEAVAKSNAFDIVHVHASMIPTLVNAGYLQPFDRFMERGGMIYRSVGPQSLQTHYHGENYGFVTDGNVFATGVRKDLFENPTERKRFEDKHGKPMKWPETWDDYLELAKFFTRPPDLYGVSDLRARKWLGPVWYLMMLYANGGFPFADDMTPTLYNDAGRKAVEWYLATKSYSTKDIAVWATTQNIPFVVGGGAFMWTYWTGGFGVAERGDSKTKGKWSYGVVPGSRLQGRLVKRSISDPVVAVVVNRRGQNPEAAYWLCQYWCTPKHSTEIVADPKLQFHDAWAPEHMKDSRVLEKYTPQGLEATAKCLEITTPGILLPGNLEFTDILDKNLADAFIGTISGDEALKKTEAEWHDVVKRIGAKLLVKDLGSYRAAFPKIDLPRG
jgi:ABC-type glycerol-3-phosphate transport system substrate-binding protein